MSDISNLSDTIVPKSDQLNSEQLLSGPMTITVTSVKRGDSEQPIAVHYLGEMGRPYKPCKTMRKVLIFAWGEDGSKWIGRSMTLYNDQSVKWAGVAVGGIRISHLSHIEKDIQMSLTATRGKKDPVFIRKFTAPAPVDNSAMDACLDAIARCGSLDDLKAAAKGFPADLSAGQKARVNDAYAERKACLLRAIEEQAEPEPQDSLAQFDAEYNETTAP